MAKGKMPVEVITLPDSVLVAVETRANEIKNLLQIEFDDLKSFDGSFLNKKYSSEEMDKAKERYETLSRFFGSDAFNNDVYPALETAGKTAKTSESELPETITALIDARSMEAVALLEKEYEHLSQPEQSYARIKNVKRQFAKQVKPLKDFYGPLESYFPEGDLKDTIFPLLEEGVRKEKAFSVARKFFGDGLISTPVIRVESGDTVESLLEQFITYQREGQSPLFHASVLELKNARDNPILYEAVKLGNVEAVEALLAVGADPREKGGSGMFCSCDITSASASKLDNLKIREMAQKKARELNKENGRAMV